jgi:sialic acid synthase SpsE
VFIGERPIGPGKPVYVIAEAGVNHNGQFDLALKLVEAAKRAGADAVKFQVFTAEGLVVADAPSAAYQSQQGYQNQRQMLRQLELTRQEFVDIHRYCHDVGIDFLATPFSIPDLEFLLDLPVQTIKLASSDLVNLPLLERTIESGAIVIASTGACSLDEIDAAVECFANRGALARLVLMHCISSYPTALADANLGQIEMLHSRYDRPVGFSDHTAEWITAALAVAAGASVLEKHFTLDPSLPGPDQAFSLNEEQLTRYVTAAREARQAMGSGPRKTLPCEEEVRRVARGSVVSAVDLPAGTTVTPAMVTVKRPSGGIEPWRIKELIGLVAVRDISADTILSWDMLQPVGSVALPASDGSYRNR